MNSGSRRVPSLILHLSRWLHVHAEAGLAATSVAHGQTLSP